MFAILLPALIGVVGLVVDGSLLMAKQRNLRQFADIAASAAAMDRLRGATEQSAIATANWQISRNHLQDVDVAVHIPPSAGPFAGDSRYVEVVLSRPVETYFIHVLGADSIRTVSATSVAGHEAASASAALVVLNPQPSVVRLSGRSPLYPSLEVNSGGLEFLGTGEVEIDGAVLVNTDWGGVDESGQPAGAAPGPPYATACPAGTVRARDIRVTGGVDDPQKYLNFKKDGPMPLRANRLPVPDPLQTLSVPTLTADSQNVRDFDYGGVRASDSEKTLHPGVYDWIEVTKSDVTFEPGIYVIRNVNPDTGLSLNISGDRVTAGGVMFYITDAADFSTTTGLPDALDGETTPPLLSNTTALPSAVIDVGAESRFSPLDDSNSPFDGLLLFQRRFDRRPIVIRNAQGNTLATFSGGIYSKWARLIVAFAGKIDARFVAGSMSIINLGNLQIAPIDLLPPARDVFLVQ